MADLLVGLDSSCSTDESLNACWGEAVERKTWDWAGFTFPMLTMLVAMDEMDGL